MFVCEGEDLVLAALDAGVEPVEVLVDAERPVLLDRLRAAENVAPGLLRDVSSLGHPARIVAVFRRADLPVLADPPPPLGIALWRVADPGNLGTLLRAADAFGPAFVALSPGCADPTGPKALRASAGSVFRVPLGAFEAAPRPWVALTPRDGTPLDVLAFSRRVTFVLGAERDGIPADVAERCDQRAWIPQTERIDSLNAAMAGTIAFWEWARRS